MGGRGAQNGKGEILRSEHQADTDGQLYLTSVGFQINFRVGCDE
jgi:hypothetical protein